jgi:hypothetical protein
MKFWGRVFLAAASMVAMFKNQQEEDEKKNIFLNSFLRFHEVLGRGVPGSNQPSGGAQA